MAKLGAVLLVIFASFIALSLSQDAQGRCPYCTGKTCGPDGVGGSCGTCQAGQKCSRGTCICDRGCTGFECGPDRCGTTCGDCMAGQSCVNGLCTGACTKQCTRTDGTPRSCGWDRCGSCCGKCPSGFRCRDGACECYPSCDNKQCGPDGCGGSCGTCLDGAFCQGDTDLHPGQCYFDCLITMRVEVREAVTNNLVTGFCDVDITGPLSFTSMNNNYTGPVPGFFSVDISKGKYGSYSFTTTCAGYISPDIEAHTVSTSDSLVTLIVNWNTILIEVRDEDSKQLLPNANISISATGYSLFVNWVSPSYTWSHNGFKTYTFTTSSTGYSSRTVSVAVNASTTIITLYLGKGSIALFVVECVTRDPVTTATITTGSQTIQYNGGASFVATQGFGQYTFTTSSGSYVTNTETKDVQATTTSITLCVNYPTINFVVTSCATQQRLASSSVVATSSFYTTYNQNFAVSSSGFVWTPVGYKGTYHFVVSSSSYTTGTFDRAVDVNTREISVCLNEAAFCGDGFCTGTETANPSGAKCFDCGRLRGVISLAIGQKDQLVNITVSVWPAPTNPATIMRSGQALPPASFTTASDTKGFFSVNQMSFDAPVTSRSEGQYKRRFYFRLSGSFLDRTTGSEQTVTLLPLWWNYELTNKQWSGTGDLTATNNSPNFYFYMTPGFSTSDALLRIILSWGTLISAPANTIPDLDLVVAGPVTQASIDQFGSGIVNFENKDEHATAGNTLLPYAKIITDSAQGFGPEVFDFYAAPGSSSLQLGWSPSYAPNAAAQAYEIWVDRPNSSPNTDNFNVNISDTNSFIVVYYNDGQVNQQQLFDQRTGVEYAYGFYNRDQWNQVPTVATMWHVIDLSQAEGGIKWTGFPGENSGGQDKSEQPGAKYAYNPSGFLPQKSIPCGHVANRGANPAYCPAILTYPQTKK